MFVLTSHTQRCFVYARQQIEPCNETPCTMQEKHRKPCTKQEKATAPRHRAPCRRNTVNHATSRRKLLHRTMQEKHRMSTEVVNQTVERRGPSRRTLGHPDAPCRRQLAGGIRCWTWDTRKHFKFFQKRIDFEHCNCRHHLIQHFTVTLSNVEPGT